MRRSSEGPRPRRRINRLPLLFVLLLLAVLFMRCPEAADDASDNVAGDVGGELAAPSVVA